MKNRNNNQQSSFLYEGLSETLNPKHPLYKLSQIVPWSEFEEEFGKKYKKNFGRPAKSIRLMVSLLMLKHMYNMSDENVVYTWLENPYWQFFSGETEFQWNFPCDPSELTVFRKRIGESGAEKILQISIKLHGRKAMESEITADTTVQEKNITFPTDTKLHLKVINWVWRIADKTKVRLRQSYKRTIPTLKWYLRYLSTPKRAKQGRSAARKIKTISARLLRDLLRKLPKDLQLAYSNEIEVSKKILSQTRKDKNKVYSFHEPEVACISKGKPNKRYEFGSKVSILTTKNSNIIVGALNFTGNPYDGHTLPSALEQYHRLCNRHPKKVLIDEGYRGRKKIGDTELLRVHKRTREQVKSQSYRKRFRRRSAIEPIIGHLKSDYRLGRNFLKGLEGDSINVMLACAAFNFKKLLSNLRFLFAKFEKALILNLVPYCLIVFALV